jgi:uncharacterized membrane protein YccC
MSYPPPPHGQPTGPWPYPVQPKEPSAIPAMVVGIIAVAGGMMCYLPILASPVALVLGRRSLNAIRRQPHLGGRGEAMAGFVLGIIGTCMLALVVLVIAGIAIWAMSDPSGFDAFMSD